MSMSFILFLIIQILVNPEVNFKYFTELKVTTLSG